MTEEEAFLQAITEAPFDDTPRLIYADWLDDHGQSERGELIRVQCELARLPEDAPARGTLSKRLRRLLRPANRSAWEAARPAFAGKGELIRGFLMPRLKEPVGKFVARRPEDFGPFPLWHVTLTGLANIPEKAERVAELAFCPHLLRAGGLSLAHSPHLDGITSLVVSNNHRLGEPGCRALRERFGKRVTLPARGI